METEGLDRKILLAVQKWRKLLKNAFQVSAKQKHTFNDVPNGFGQKARLVRCSQTGLHLGQATGNLNLLKR